MMRTVVSKTLRSNEVRAPLGLWRPSSRRGGQKHICVSAAFCVNEGEGGQGKMGCQGSRGGGGGGGGGGGVV